MGRDLSFLEKNCSPGWVIPEFPANASISLESKKTRVMAAIGLVGAEKTPRVTALKSHCP